MNTMKTYMLLAAMTALFGVAGLAMGGTQGMVVALGIGAVMNAIAYWNADKMVLKMHGAKEVQDGPLVDMVRELSQGAGMPMPKVYIMATEQPNAFATGRDPSHAAVAATRGIMRILNERELRGVMAHELAHIRNRDTLTMTITATIAGALSMLANFGMMTGGGFSRNDEGGRGVHPLILMGMMILAPLAASIVQMAISRTREFSADKGGAEISGDPMALADALLKLEQGAHAIPNRAADQNPATAHMFIVNPLHMKKMLGSMFRTHPLTEDRVAKLKTYTSGYSRLSDQNPWD